MYVRVFPPLIRVFVQVGVWSYRKDTPNIKQRWFTYSTRGLFSSHTVNSQGGLVNTSSHVDLSYFH